MSDLSLTAVIYVPEVTAGVKSSLESLLEDAPPAFTLCLVRPPSARGVDGILHALSLPEDKRSITECGEKENRYALWNRVATNCGSDIVYFAVPPFKVLPGFLSKGLVQLESVPEAALLLGASVVKDPFSGYARQQNVSVWEQTAYADPRVWREEFLLAHPPLYFNAAGCLFHRSRFLEAGGFPTELDGLAECALMSLLGLKHGVCYQSERAAVAKRIEDDFCLLTDNHPSRALAVVAKAAAWMRSHPEFEADLAGNWEEHTVSRITEAYLHSFEEPFRISRTRFRDAAPYLGFVDRGLFTLSGLVRRAMSAQLRKKLRENSD